ncbi:hypothetical protein F2P81_014403 [Scophthalmus maximus]|uniref:Uncharacterized protein n=1 Tax=Scophthalmus maximus TaxID=52904 RepID=A0A6A4SMC2_SCOMX|nr:hypothetical protein F2P81_014403 [Scophthalmus maximus]
MVQTPTSHVSVSSGHHLLRVKSLNVDTVREVSCDSSSRDLIPNNLRERLTCSSRLLGDILHAANVLSPIKYVFYVDHWLRLQCHSPFVLP